MPMILAPIGMAILAGAGAVAAAAATVPLIGGLLAAGVTAIGGVAAGLVGVSSAAALGIAGGVTVSLGTAIASWSTVAMLASVALRPSRVGVGAGGSQVDFQADPNAGIPLILGRTGTAGKTVHMNTSGQSDKNKALMYLLALSAGPIQSVESLTAGDFLVTLDGTGKATAPSQFANQMYLNHTNGLKPEPAALFPAGVAPSVLPEWTSACKTSGVACAWWTLLYDTKAYPAGVPKPLFVVLGPAVYDPRQDSTVPGGSGTQRWDDEATWGFAGNDNPFLQGLTWVIGRRDNGVLTFGVGAPLDAIDVAAFIEGANVAQANGWKVGGEVLSSDRKWDVLTTILQAGGGEPSKLAGRISCCVRTPRVSLLTISGLDCIGDVSITGTKARKDRFNQIIPNYRSEAHAWEMVPAGPVNVSTYITADGGLRSREANYPLVQNAEQAAQLACYDILDAREFEPIALPLGPAFTGLQPGDAILINEPEFGMANQQVLIQTRELDPTSGKLTFTARSETPGKDAYALGRTPNPPPIPSLQPINPGYVSQPGAGSWSAVGGVLSGPDGAAIPAIIITGAADDPAVAGVIVDYAYQLPGGGYGPVATTEAPGLATRIELRGLISGGVYHVMIRYRSIRGVEGPLFLDLGLVTAGTLLSYGVTQIGGQTPDELIAQLNETTELGQETSDQAAQTAADLLPVQADATYSKERVDLIGTRSADGLTFVMNDTTLYSGPGQTWAQYKTSTQSAINNNSAAITNEATTRANADTSMATNITNVNTKADNNAANITTLQSSVNGLNAQWVLSVSSTGPGYARVAGIKVASNPAVSSIAFAADQIGFTNGTDNVFPLAVVGGKVYATNFQADDIKAGTITTNKIVANNISETTTGQTSASSVLGTSPATVLTMNIVCSGGYIDVDFLANAFANTANDQFGIGLTVDGVSAGGGYVAPVWTAMLNNQLVGRYRVKPAAGSRAFVFTSWKYTAGAAVTLGYLNVRITDNKTQA